MKIQKEGNAKKFRSINMQALKDAIVRRLEDFSTEETVHLRARDYPLVARIHELADVLEQSYEGDTVTLRFRANAEQAARLRKWMESPGRGTVRSLSVGRPKGRKAR